VQCLSPAPAFALRRPALRYSLGGPTEGFGAGGGIRTRTVGMTTDSPSPRVCPIPPRPHPSFRRHSFAPGRLSAVRYAEARYSPRGSAIHKRNLALCRHKGTVVPRYAGRLPRISGASVQRFLAASEKLDRGAFCRANQRQPYAQENQTQNDDDHADEQKDCPWHLIGISEGDADQPVDRYQEARERGEETSSPPHNKAILRGNLFRRTPPW
jgi:hypothetical protein